MHNIVFFTSSCNWQGKLKYKIYSYSFEILDKWSKFAQNFALFCKYVIFCALCYSQCLLDFALVNIFTNASSKIWQKFANFLINRTPLQLYFFKNCSLKSVINGPNVMSWELDFIWFWILVYWCSMMVPLVFLYLFFTNIILGQYNIGVKS